MCAKYNTRLHTHTHTHTYVCMYIYIYIYIGCPTRYQTRHFFNNSNTNEDTATKFEQEYVCCVRNEGECVRSVCVFRCNIFIGVRIIKEIAGSVASGTPCVCVCVCIYIYVCVYIYMCVCMCVCLCVRLCGALYSVLAQMHVGFPMAFLSEF